MMVSLQLYPTVIYMGIRGFDKAGLALVRWYLEVRDPPKAPFFVVSASRPNPPASHSLPDTFPAPIYSLAVLAQQQKNFAFPRCAG